MILLAVPVVLLFLFTLALIPPLLLLLLPVWAAMCISFVTPFMPKKKVVSPMRSRTTHPVQGARRVRTPRSSSS